MNPMILVAIGLGIAAFLWADKKEPKNASDRTDDSNRVDNSDTGKQSTADRESGRGSRVTINNYTQDKGQFNVPATDSNGAAIPAAGPSGDGNNLPNEPNPADKVGDPAGE